MKLSYVLMANGFVGFGFGSALLWAPTLVLLAFDIQASPAEKVLMQLVGAALLAYSIVTVAGGTADDDSPMQKVAALARLVSEGIGAFVLLLGLIGGHGNTIIWVLLALYLAFTVGYIIWGIPILRKKSEEG